LRRNAKKPGAAYWVGRREYHHPNPRHSDLPALNAHLKDVQHKKTGSGTNWKKRNTSMRAFPEGDVKDWEIIADKLSKAGWSLGWVPAIDSQGRTIWIVDAHGYGKRFIVRADEMLTAFVELRKAIHDFAVSLISWSPRRNVRG